jgi:uncharacterized membrane protein YkvI
MANWFQRFVMPGLVFESVVIGGGYATGRELVEFFLRHGPLAGLLGLVATLIVWGIVLAVTFEFARLTSSFDYRTFFVHLIGRAWVLYDILYYVTLILVLSVIGAACSTLFHQSFGMPGWLGAAVLMLCAAFLVYFGNTLVERVLSAWGIALYALYGGIVVWCLTHYAAVIGQNLRIAPTDASWIAGGVAYAGYNLAAAPAVLFCLRHASRRRDAVIAGLAGGAFAVLPGILLYVSVIAFYPAITREPVPAVAIVSNIGSRTFSFIFELALFITLIKTGVGLLHALNERIAAAFSLRRAHMPRGLRPLVTLGILTFALFLADRVGIIALVARGYGTITYGFLAIYVLPIMTIGLWRVCRGAAAAAPAQESA